MAITLNRGASLRAGSTQEIPDFTIVTPTLNQASYIEQTIKSVISQEGVSVQYIVVDGGSTDGTHNILDRYRKYISTIIIEADEGQAHALKKGFAIAKGNLAAYLNSDDYLLPGALVRVKEIMAAHPGIDMIYGDRIFVDDNDHFLRYWMLPAHSDYVMMRWDYIPQEASFWRRQSMDDVGTIDCSYKFAMDYDLFARMMLSGKKLRHFREFFSVFREHSSSKTSTIIREIGIPEMHRVRQRVGIRIRQWDKLLLATYILQMWILERLQQKFGRMPERFSNRERNLRNKSARP